MKLNKRLSAYFALALFATLFFRSFFPSIQLLTFTPFLATVTIIKPLLPALWIASGCGCILDLITTEFPFGTHTLLYAITVAILYSQRRHFYCDKPLHLSIYTILFSLVITFLQLVLMKSIGTSFSLHLKGFLSDFIAMPLLDCLYALLWFQLPLFLYRKIRFYWITKKSSQKI